MKKNQNHGLVFLRAWSFFSPSIFLWKHLEDDKMPFYKIAFSVKGMACKAISYFIVIDLKTIKETYF